MPADKYELALKATPSFANEEEQKKEFDPKSALNLIFVQNCGLTILSDSVGNCKHLAKIDLSFNNLTVLPEALGQLKELMYVNISNNKLTCLPKSFANLTKIQSLILTNNELTDEGLDHLGPSNCLLVLDLSHNNLTRIPPCVGSPASEKLHTINISNNKIVEITDSFDVPCIKDFNASNNLITRMPKVLTNYPKIKFLNLSGNPFKDSRFRKLANDPRPKSSAILTFITKFSATEPKTPPTSRSPAPSPVQSSPEPGSITLAVRTDVPNLVVESDPSVKSVRNFLVCCVLNNLDLSGQNFKKFINIQTTLHASMCDNRTTASIGTHEMKSFVPPLNHLALPAENIHITSLHKKTPVSGKDLIDVLVRDADFARRRTKRNTLNPLHKYLHLVQQLSLLPCLTDSNGLVISLQPVTNSDLTKMSESTTSVFVEVSSNVSLQLCKDIMNALVMETIKISPEISIDQVRVCCGPDLVSIYPDKSDLVELQLKREVYQQ